MIRRIAIFFPVLVFFVVAAVFFSAAGCDSGNGGGDAGIADGDGGQGSDGDSQAQDGDFDGWVLSFPEGLKFCQWNVLVAKGPPYGDFSEKIRIELKDTSLNWPEKETSMEVELIERVEVSPDGEPAEPRGPGFLQARRVGGLQRRMDHLLVFPGVWSRRREFHGVFRVPRRAAVTRQADRCLDLADQ